MERAADLELEGLLGDDIATGSAGQRPKMDGPKIEGPKMDGPKIEGPKMDGPKIEDPKMEGSVVRPLRPT